MVFGPGGTLYVGTGDAGDRAGAGSGPLGGKILRLPPDGAPAPDNPFRPAAPATASDIATCRASRSTTDGRLWASEFGQNTW